MKENNILNYGNQNIVLKIFWVKTLMQIWYFSFGAS